MWAWASIVLCILCIFFSKKLSIWMLRGNSRRRQMRLHQALKSSFWISARSTSGNQNFDAENSLGWRVEHLRDVRCRPQQFSITTVKKNEKYKATILSRVLQIWKLLSRESGKETIIIEKFRNEERGCILFWFADLKMRADQLKPLFCAAYAIQIVVLFVNCLIKRWSLMTGCSRCFNC